MINVLNDIFEYDAVVNSYYFPLIKNKLSVATKDYSRDIKALETKKERIMNAYIDGSFDLETYNRKNKKLMIKLKN